MKQSKIAFYFKRFIAITYLILIVIVFFGGVTDVLLEHAIFILVNFIVSMFFLRFLNKGNDFYFSIIVYSSFLLVYIVKGVLQYFIGLESLYNLMSIRNSIDLESYKLSILYVTYAHIVVSATLIFSSYIRFFRKIERDIKISSVYINLSLVLITFIIVSTTLIMMAFSVAVMGGEPVQLPFKLSGIFFYTRKYAIPLVLLYFIQYSLLKNDKQLLLYSTFVFAIFVLSDIITRATKGPIFLFLLQFTSLYLMLLISGKYINFRIKVSHYFIALATSLILWPIIENYRELVIVGASAINSADNVDIWTSFQYGFFHLFNRFLGFLQFAGLIVDRNQLHDLDVILGYDSVGHYYTKAYLNYTQQGHLSSPSLLGSAYIITKDFWLVVVSAFVLVSSFLWKLCNNLLNWKIPVQCLLVVEIVNTIMAGTFEFMLKNVFILFLISVIISLLFKLKLGKNQ